MYGGGAAKLEGAHWLSVSAGRCFSTASPTWGCGSGCFDCDELLKDLPKENNFIVRDKLGRVVWMKNDRIDGLGWGKLPILLTHTVFYIIFRCGGESG